jgi:kinesin family protein 2/24
MDAYFFENRDFFANRIEELEILSRSSRTVESSDPSKEVHDTAVCVRIRPLTEEEIGWDHIQGVVRDNFGAANIYEPRRKVNGKPDLNVRISHAQYWSVVRDPTTCSGFANFSC